MLLPTAPLTLPTGLLDLALAFLGLAFGMQRRVVLRLASGLFNVAGNFVGQALGSVLELTHDITPCNRNEMNSRPAITATPCPGACSST